MSKTTRMGLVIILSSALMNACGGASADSAAALRPAPSTHLISASPSSLSFGNVSLGTTSTQSVALSNNGSSSVRISAVNASGTGFSVSGISLPATLAAGQSASLTIAFLPYSAGSVTGTLSVMSNATNSPSTVSLSGTGYSYAGVMGVNPASTSFGSVNVGNSSSQAVVLTNSGNATVTLSGVSSSAAAFSGSGMAFPVSLAAGQSATLNVVFAPTSAGSAAGTVTVASNASNAPTAIAVSGTGAAATQPPAITTQPVSQTIISGQAATFSVAASGTAPMSYQWQKNGTPMSGATAASYTTSAETTADNGAQFSAVVTNSAGSASSSAATLTVNAATYTLSASPTSLSFGSVNTGSNSTLKATLTNTGNSNVTVASVSASGAGYSASGISTGQLLTPGQTATLSVTFAPSAAGSVSGSVALASNASNSPISVGLTGSGVVSAQPPTITTQPASQTIIAGQTATFSVAASGTAPLSYQWQMNRAAISGATAASYTTRAETIGASGEQFAVVVTNGAGNVTSNAATLTVNAATYLLNASPTSLSFGNVNVGTSGSLSATLTNGGNSSVTISGYSVSSGEYTASGVSAGLILSPGQTLTVSVAFAPSSAGSWPGTVTVTSNASNSPVTISLSGSGVTPSTGGTPTCGKSGDTTNHVPADWTTFVAPAKGQSYVDATFGCTVTRITDASSDDWSGSFYLPLNMGYATVSPFNANDSMLMLSDGWRRYFVTDLSGNILVSIANMPAMNDTWVLWDSANVNVFYYTNGNSMMQGTINGSAVTTATVHQFTEYAAVNFMDETDVSQDGAHVVIVGGDTSGSNSENLFDYDFAANTKGPIYTTTCKGSVGAPNNGCLHKLIQTPDNSIIIQFAPDGSGIEQGNELWTGAVALPKLQSSTNHLDAGYDKAGNAVFIEVGNSYVVAGETNPCPSGWGLDVRMIYTPALAVCLLDDVPAWHVGYRGNANQPWVGLSFFDSGRTPSPEWFDGTSNYTAPTSSTWQTYEDEIMVVRVDANNNSSYVYRLARAYSRSNEDFYSQPHAAISRDGKYMAFNSNMAYAHTGCPASSQTSTGCTDVYIIKVQ
jgi:ASPM-SPD-2-Hydin domain-containing protein/HYDIN/CFA65/VesB family protein/immunoglobulin I-set domain protein